MRRKPRPTTFLAPSILRCCAALLLCSLSCGLPGQSSQAIDASLAEAAVLEHTRGDLSGAEALLRSTLAKTEGEDRGACLRALAELLLRQGRHEDAATSLSELARADSAHSQWAKAQMHQQGRDPMSDFVRQLDAGPRNKVSATLRQLNELGGAAVPAVLAHVSELGPFGLDNALYFLTQNYQPAVGAKLRERIASGDATWHVLVARHLNNIPAEAATEFATALAESPHGEARASALAELIRRPAKGQDSEQLMAKALADSSSEVRESLAQALQSVSGASADSTLRQLLADTSESVRHTALNSWLARRESGQEKLAMQVLRSLPEEMLRYIGPQVGRTHAGWPRVGGFLLAAIPVTQEHVITETLGAFDWSAAPAASAEAILALAMRTSPKRNSSLAQQIGIAITRVVEAGWQITPAQAEQLAKLMPNLSWQRETWIQAVPADDEATAMLLYAQLPVGDKWNTTGTIVARRRPWPNLLVSAFAEIPGLLHQTGEFEWPLNSPAATTKLLNLHTKLTDNDKSALMRLISRSGGKIAASGIVSFLADSYVASRAADYLLEHDPQAFLDRLREMERIPEGIDNQLVVLFTQHAGPDDLPTMLRAAVQRAFFIGSGYYTELLAAIDAHGGGDPRILELAVEPCADRGTWKQRVDAATRAAYRLQPTRFSDALALAPRLPFSVVNPMLQNISAAATTDHIDGTLRLLNRALAMPEQQSSRREPLIKGTLDILTRVGNRAATPVVRRALTHSDAYARTMAAETLLSIGAREGNATEILSELLAQTEVEPVQVALSDAATAADADLRKKAIELIQKNPEAKLGLATFLSHLPGAERVALAQGLLIPERIPELSDAQAADLLAAIGDEKDGGNAEVLARGLIHPSAAARRHAAKQLGRTMDQRAAPFLLEALRDDDEKVVAEARGSLNRIANYLDELDSWQRRFK